jgi:cell division protein FtsW
MVEGLSIERSAVKIHADHVLIVTILLLSALGFITLYSGSYGLAERYFNDGLYFVERQIAFGIVGLALFFISIYIPLDFIRRYIVIIVLGTIILCLLTLVPGIGVDKNGASRWIGIGGYTYQPSELVKLVLPLYLAHIFDKKKDVLSSFIRGILPPTLITGLFFTIIYMQNNLSTAIFVALNALVIFFLAGVSIRYFAGALAILLPISSLLILTSRFRLLRVLSFMNPELEPLGAGYQVRASILTIISGGFWGKGLGEGTRKVASVPYIQSDFIFASYAEELGFLGVLFFFAIFVIFAIRGYRAALGSTDLFRRLLATGLVTVIASQALFNVAVTAGAIPATGVPLPFVSAGGSALVTTLVAAGLVVNVSRGVTSRPGLEGAL